jgi:hypothetical protein
MPVFASVRIKNALKTLYWQIIQNDINRHRSSVEAINELHRKKKVKAKDIKLDQMNNTWREVMTLSTTMYTEITTVFVKTLKKFDVWIVTRLKRLESGELLTSDLLVFEENLSVCLYWVPCSKYSNATMCVFM